MVPSSSEPCLMGSGTKNMHVNLVDQQRTPGVFFGIWMYIGNVYSTNVFYTTDILYTYTPFIP